MARTGKYLADQMHKAFVVACMAATIAGLGVIGLRAGNYFMYVYPEIKARKVKEEEGLLLEGKPKDNLIDSATTLSN